MCTGLFRRVPGAIFAHTFMKPLFTNVADAILYHVGFILQINVEVNLPSIVLFGILTTVILIISKEIPCKDVET